MQILYPVPMICVLDKRAIRPLHPRHHLSEDENMWLLCGKGEVSRSAVFIV